MITVQRAAFCVAVASTLVVCSDPPEPRSSGTVPKRVGDSDRKRPDPDPVADLTAKVDQFAVVELTADVSDLPESERTALRHIIAAAKLLDPVFDRQAFGKNPELEHELQADQSPAGKLRYTYFRIMRGPWDRQNHMAPFAIDRKRPPGAGFYPEDIVETDLRRWIEDHPEDKEAFESLVTVIRREGDRLIAVPYGKAFAEWLEPAAEELRKAAAATSDASLRKFLTSRAKAFSTDDYYASDRDWMDLDSRVEVTIGPYETYEDELLGVKGSFEAFVTVSDPTASAALEKFKKHLPAMERHLPVADEVKTVRGRESPIRVVDLVFSSGDARKSVQTIAFNLPNDERVRKEKGAKKVLLRNSIQTKFETIMKPIGERVLAQVHHGELSSDAFFHEVLFHELSHSLGPAFVGSGDDKVEVRVALGPAYTAIEEAKADVMGVYNILFMIEKGELPKTLRKPVLTSYFAGLFRSVRFGVTEAHGKGAAVQINRHIDHSAATYDPVTTMFSIDHELLEESIEKLVRELVMLQHRGDRTAVDEFLARNARMQPGVAKALERLRGIPVDIRPVYPLAGETTPR